MSNQYRSFCILCKNIRQYSTKVKPKVEVNKEVNNNIENGLFKPRKHPGIFKPRTINLPDEFVGAIKKALKDYPVKQILSDSHTLSNYLRARHSPVEEIDYKNKKAEVVNNVLSKYAELQNLTNEELNNLKERFAGKIAQELKTKLYAWKPIDFDVPTCLQYLFGRSAAEYSVLVRIFQEISIRDPNFKPRTFFDFGSGVGTGTWAAKLFWQKSIFEYFNVDCSVHMNDLALILLKGGTGMAEPNLKGVFYRQFLPATNTTYDLVLSAYSLLELPSSQTRLETILKLWNKTQNYLVIVEQGTRAGFKIINEVRDFISDIKNDNNKGYIFSPCPHDETCPKFLSDSLIPCNFEMAYTTIPIGQISVHQKERYSYVVFRKGKRQDETDFWPRIVQPTLLRSKHAICRMCVSQGKLQEVIFTASKHGKTTYQCAKASKWGDLLPMKIETFDENPEE